jgi:hypothetical protein
MHKYIEHVVDVKGDGHCGFRVVSVLLEKSTYDHNMARLDITIKMNKNQDRYLKLYGGKEMFDYLMNALTPNSTGAATREKCMTIPNMGFLLAHKYKHAVAVTAATVGYSKTYFPLEGASTATKRLMCLAWVNENISWPSI